MCNHISGLLSNPCNPVFKSRWWVIMIRFTITTDCLEMTTLGKLFSHSLCLERWCDDNHDELYYYNLGEHHGDGNDDNKGEVDDRSHPRPLKSCASLSKAVSVLFSRGKSRMEDLALSHLGWEDLTTVIIPGLIFFLKVGLTELSEEDSAVGNFISSVQGSPIKWVVGLSHVLDHLSTHWNRTPGLMIKPYSGIPERFRFPL